MTRRARKQPLRAAGTARKAIRFLQSLEIPEGPRAGRPLRLAPFQRSFVIGALAPDVNVGVLSVARGNAKTALCAGIALGALVGEIDDQPRREIPICARTRDQGRIAYELAVRFSRALPEETQKRLTFRRSPRLEIAYEDDDGDHLIRVLPADGKSALGLSPTLALLDERASWPLDQGNQLEAAIMTALGKRGGRALIISTSAADDAHPFSKWLDEDQPGVYRQEHRPAEGLPADDRESLLIANPGAEHGIGASLEWLEAMARRAIARGGSTLSSFRLLNRNERVADENRSVLLTIDEWLKCETDDLPPREGPCVVGIDLGGSASMTAAAFYWPETGRLECLGWFPGEPSLLDRGQSDGVGARYVEMQERGELRTLGAATVPVAAFIGESMRHVEGQPITAIAADRFKRAEFSEALAAASVTAPIVWRGFGWRDGNEDCDRFRRACFDANVKARPSLLLRSAFADAVTLRDPAGNLKLAKGRSLGRIDPAAAAVLAVAEGARQRARPGPKPGRLIWT